MKYISPDRKANLWVQRLIALLLGVFLLLSSCPVRKSLFNLANADASPKANKIAGNKSIVLSNEQEKSVQECPASTEIVLHQVDLTAKTGSLFIPFVAGLFLLQTAFSVSSRFRKTSLLFHSAGRRLKTVPLYIRNRILLI